MGGYALVLGGGGAKGSYEIGVWKALRELNIPIQAVTGTSVGALNGAMIVQDDYETAYKLWTGLTVESVINVNREIAVENEDKKVNLEFMKLLKDAVYSKGLDVSPLREMLMEVIDEDKIRQSNIDFGIVTFSITDFKPLKLFKSDMKDGQLIEYLLASACFPAFKPQEIEKKKFIDGGVYDNVPISMIIDKKIKDIIMVDVSGPGLVRKFNKKGLNIIEIKNSGDLGGVLDFNIDKAKRNIEMGYYDTLKAFGKLKGNQYYIVPSEVNFLRREDLINDFSISELKKMYSFLGMEITGKGAASNRIIIDRIMRTIQQYSNGNLEVETLLPAMAEITAEQLGIEKSRLYTIDELTETILDEYNKIKNSEDFGEYINNIKRLIFSRNQLEFDIEIKKTIVEAKFLMAYEADINENDDKIKKFRRFLAVAFPKISIANMFIALIVSKTKQGESSDS